jgi:hypothetical protein
MQVGNTVCSACWAFLEKMKLHSEIPDLKMQIWKCMKLEIKMRELIALPLSKCIVGRKSII